MQIPNMKSEFFGQLFVELYEEKERKIVIITHKFWSIFSMLTYKISFIYRYHIIFRCWIHVWKQFSSLGITFSFVLHEFWIYFNKNSHEENFYHYNTHRH